MKTETTSNPSMTIKYPEQAVKYGQADWKAGQQDGEKKEEYFSRLLGNGPYHNVARELFSDCQQLLHLSVPQAERVAACYQADLGRYFKTLRASSISIGNASKAKSWDGQVNLKMAVDKVKGHLTHSLCVAKLCAMLQDAKQYGILKYDVELAPALSEWLAGSKTQDLGLGEEKD